MALIEPDGSVVRSLDFTEERPFNTEFMVSRMKVTPVFGTLTSAGELAVLLQEGQIVKEAADGTRIRSHALPTDSPFVPRIQESFDLGGDRLFIVYRDSPWGAHEPNLGFVVYDLAATVESSGACA
ncbi:MAG: hypothetical protein GEU75_13330 [Dehalococcoidia bacterium]|nr:hypothetical protein [Dehalococcoidia bacterium]